MMRSLLSEGHIVIGTVNLPLAVGAPRVSFCDVSFYLSRLIPLPAPYLLEKRVICDLRLALYI
jgi:hypothetical protein